MRYLELRWLVVMIPTMIILSLLAVVANSAAIQATPTPAPTSTYIQFPETDMDRTPAPPPTGPEIPLYAEMPTPVPFADMPLLYYPDDAHNADCWVTFNQMAISCLRRPAYWPCEGKASR